MEQGYTPMLNVNPAMLQRALERLEQATHDHAAWQEHLLRVIFCGEPLRAEDRAPGAHIRCHLGRWYYEQAPPELPILDREEEQADEKARIGRAAAGLVADKETIFLGSGTTLMAADLTERVCYGIEIDPRYVDVAVLRWQNFTGGRATLDGDGRTFEETRGERLQDDPSSLPRKEE